MNSQGASIRRKRKKPVVKTTSGRTLDSWLDIGEMLGVGYDDISSEQWARGCEHEMEEHFDTVGGDLVTIAKIALDHLRTDPDYYRKLEKIEG